MIEILKNNKLMAELSFSENKYDIRYLEENSDIETWYFVYKDGKYFSVNHTCMIPYDIEYAILSHKASLEYNGYKFNIL